MYNYYENFHDGDFEFEEEAGSQWSEFDWQSYVKESNSEIARFLTHYSKLKASENCLEETFKAMGWANPSMQGPAKELYIVEANFNLDEDDDDEDESFGEGEFDAFAEASSDPYSIHRHPLFVSTCGLLQYVHSCWGTFLDQEPKGLTHKGNWKFAQSLIMAHHHVVMAMQFLNDTEYSACVCHGKFVLSAINICMSYLQQVPLASASFAAPMQKEILRTLFYLRDIWLQVIKDSRELS